MSLSQSISSLVIICLLSLTLMIGCSAIEAEPASSENDSELPADICNSCSVESSTISSEWLEDLARLDLIWAEQQVDLVIASYKKGTMQEEKDRIERIQKALKTVAGEEPLEDYRAPLFLSVADSTRLAQKMHAAGLNSNAARHTPWNYKDGFLKGLTLILQDAQRKAGTE